MGEDDHQTMHGVRGVRLSDVLLIRGLGKWKLKTMKTINFDSGFCESRKGDGGHLSSLAFYAREQITPIPFTTAHPALTPQTAVIFMNIFIFMNIRPPPYS